MSPILGASSSWGASMVFGNSSSRFCTRYPPTCSHWRFPFQSPRYRRVGWLRGTISSMGRESRSVSSQWMVCHESKEAMAELSSLLEVLKEENMTQGKRGVCESLGKELTLKVEALRAEKEAKSLELIEVKRDLQSATEELQETTVLLVACQGELELATATVETLKEEVEAVRASREEDYRSTLARYRELEEALAHAQYELESRSLQGDVVWSSASDLKSLQETVKNQEKVLGDLFGALEKAKLDKANAETAARDMEKSSKAQKDKIFKLQSQHDALLGNVEDVKAALMEAEKMWAEERKKHDVEKAGLQQQLQNAKALLSEKTSALTSTSASLAALQLQLSKQQNLTESLQRRCNELVHAKESVVEGKGMNKVDKPIDLHVRARALDSVRADLADACAQRDGLRKQAKILAKEVSLRDDQISKLRGVVRGLEQRVQDKHQELGAVNKEKRSAVLQAQNAGRQLKAMENEASRLRSRLDDKIVQADKLSVELEASETREVSGKVVIAKVQQELEQQLEHQALQIDESKDLQDKTVQLRTQLLKQEQEHDKYRKGREAKVAKLEAALRNMQVLVDQAQTSQTTNDGALEDKYAKLEELAEAEKAEHAAHVSTAKQQQRELEMKLKALLADQESSKALILEAQEAKNKAEQKLSEMQLQMSSSVDSSGLEAHKAELDSLRKVSEGKGLELAEAGSVIAELSHQIESLQEALEIKQSEFDKTKSKFVANISSLKKKMVVMEREAADMHGSVESQQNALKSAIEGKTLVESRVDELEKQLAGKHGDVASLTAQLNSEMNKGAALQRSLESSQAALEDLKRVTAEEMDATAHLLEKAEKVALATRESMVRSQQEGGSDAGNVNLQNREELNSQISKLESLLEEQSLAAAQALSHAQNVEEEVATLSKRVVELETEQTPDSEKNDHALRSLQLQLSQSMAQEAAAQEEIHQLRKQVESMYSGASKETPEQQGSTSSDELRLVNAHVSELEEENNRLRRMAAKRNEVLAQSKKFIEQYLQRSIVVLGQD